MWSNLAYVPGNLNAPRELPCASKAVNGLLKKLDDLTGQLHAANDTEANINGRMHVAETADIQAHADALRAGEPAPEDVHLPQWQKEMHTATRARQALGVAVQQIENELREAVVKERDAWLSRIGSDLAAHRSQLDELLDQFVKIYTSAMVLIATEEFVSNSADRFHLRPGLLDGRQAAETIAELRASMHEQLSD
jgi:hypothetical protein